MSTLFSPDSVPVALMRGYLDWPGFEVCGSVEIKRKRLSLLVIRIGRKSGNGIVFRGWVRFGGRAPIRVAMLGLGRGT